MKRLCSIILLLAVLSCLTACGKGSQAGQTNDTQRAEEMTVMKMSVTINRISFRSRAGHLRMQTGAGFLEGIMTGIPVMRWLSVRNRRRDMPPFLR